MQQYFQVTPPTVHQMVLALERNGFISRKPGKARSIHLLVPATDFPDLERAIRLGLPEPSFRCLRWPKNELSSVGAATIDRNTGFEIFVLGRRLAQS